MATSKRTPATNKNKPLALPEEKDSVYNATTNDTQTENKETNILVNKEIGKQEYKRQTYFLSEDLIDAIAAKSFYKKMDKSEIVREALKSYIEEEFFNRR